MMTQKLKRSKKALRVIKKKWRKPGYYTILIALLIYYAISHSIQYVTSKNDTQPQFIITRLSDTFEQSEFMHLLLTVQEIRKNAKLNEELIEFANSSYPGLCPYKLQKALYRMNWDPQAFLVRVKKMFALYDDYEHISRLDETIAFLESKSTNNQLPIEIQNQIDILKIQKETLIKEKMTSEEYRFIKKYAGLIQTFKQD